MSVEEKKEFYAKRQKEFLSKEGRKTGRAVYHVYDDDGNLVFKNKDGGIERTLVLPQYRSVSLDEMNQMEQLRSTQIAEATKAYDNMYDLLHTEYHRKDRSDTKIMEYTRELIKADYQLQYARYPVRSIIKEEGIEIRKLDFNQPSEIRKLPYHIASLQVNPYTLQDMYVREGPAPPVAMKSVSEIKAEEVGPVILFKDSDTNEYGFLSLDWPVELTIKDIRYHSAKQALAVELATAFGDEDNRKKFMSALTPQEISYSMDDIKEIDATEWSAQTARLLYDIHDAKFRQYPALQARLLETQNAVLASYIPNDLLLGIGIPMEDIRAKNPIHWTGQNLLGKVLMDVRKKLQEEANLKVSVSKKKTSLSKKKKAPTLIINEEIQPVLPNSSV